MQGTVTHFRSIPGSRLKGKTRRKKTRKNEEKKLRKFKYFFCIPSTTYQKLRWREKERKRFLNLSEGDVLTSVTMVHISEFQN